MTPEERARAIVAKSPYNDWEGTLTAAIAAAIRDAERAGWEAGRDAAAAIAEERITKYHARIEFVQSLGEVGPWVEQDWSFEAGAIAVRIRGLTPPTSGGQP
jgi:hypothetical protein